MDPNSVILALPNHDFDPSEVAIPWQILTGCGYQVVFATEDGLPGEADPLMISGEGLDPWGFIPLLKKIRQMGLILRADGNARQAYQRMIRDPHFQNPYRYDQLKVADFVGLILPGGHAPKMRRYLESQGEPSGYWSVESEVKRALATEQDYIDVDPKAPNGWLIASGLARDSMDNDKPAWVVRDGNYLSARWPGDVHTLSKQFIALLPTLS